MGIAHSVTVTPAIEQQFEALAVRGPAVLLVQVALLSRRLNDLTTRQPGQRAEGRAQS
jgi:hypothetical protein